MTDKKADYWYEKYKTEFQKRVDLEARHSNLGKEYLYEIKEKERQEGIKKVYENNLKSERSKTRILENKIKELEKENLNHRNKFYETWEFRKLKEIVLCQAEGIDYYATKAVIMEDSPYPDDISEVCNGNLCVQVEGDLARKIQVETKEVVEKLRSHNAT